MTLQREYHADADLLRVRATGVLTEEEVLTFSPSVHDGSTVSEGSAVLWDLTGVQEVRVRTQAVRRMAEMADALAPPRLRTAVVSSDAQVRGLVHLYALLREESEQETRLFRTVNEALTWLGVSANTTREG